MNHKQSPSSSAQMKKVRKEIRDLSNLEWDAIVNALWIMKETTDTDGTILYGKHFISYDSMISKHMTAGHRTYRTFLIFEFRHPTTTLDVLLNTQTVLLKIQLSIQEEIKLTSDQSLVYFTAFG